MKSSPVRSLALLLTAGAASTGCTAGIPKTRQQPPGIRAVVRTAEPNTSLSKLLKGNAEVRLRLYKSTYRLEVLQRGRVVKTYPVVLGGNPKDDKLREGDQCTPEGDFLVRGKYPHRDWDRFLWLNYPTAKSWEKHREAKDARRIPQGAGIGSGIGIHGVPVGRDEWIDRRENWTLGCISLKRAHIEELYSVLKVGTKVSILP